MGWPQWLRKINAIETVLTAQSLSAIDRGTLLRYTSVIWFIGTFNKSDNIFFSIISNIEKPKNN